MAKVIRIEENGYVWHIPLMFVAESRADYYANDPDSNRDEEIEYVMGDDFEGIDWFKNNMNFSDAGSVAKLVQSPERPVEPSMDAECDIVDGEYQ